MQPSGFLFRGWMLVGLVERGKTGLPKYIEQVKKLLHLELGYIAMKKPRKINKKTWDVFLIIFIMILSWYPKLGVAYYTLCGIYTHAFLGCFVFFSALKSRFVNAKWMWYYAKLFGCQGCFHTPKKLTWNLQITHLERNMIGTKPPWLCSMLVCFLGCFLSKWAEIFKKKDPV